MIIEYNVDNRLPQHKIIITTIVGSDRYRVSESKSSLVKELILVYYSIIIGNDTQTHTHTHTHTHTKEEYCCDIFKALLLRLAGCTSKVSI
jgi:hypothetical protein